MAAISSEVAQSAYEAAESASPWNARKLAQLGYGIAALAVSIGWLLTRYFTLFDPHYGAGYWLGIVGGSLMAVLLLYPVRKRVRLMQRLGATKHWFRMHMIFGVAGPILILYHSNFQLGSFNSNVALACTLLVAASGLVGRYIHAKVHTDLDGHRTTLKELIARAGISREQQSKLATLAPNLLERMSKFDSVVLAPPGSFFGSVALPLKLAITTRIGQIQLSFYACRQLAAQARKSPIIRAEQSKLRRSMLRFVAEHLRRVRRVAELHSYERLFALWHVFHLPLFYVLVLTAIVHIVAVHMY